MGARWLGLFVVIFATWWPARAEGQLTAQLTLAGANLPPGPLNVQSNPAALPSGMVATVRSLYQLAGVNQIPSDARIQEVKILRISSGTFAPGVIQAEVRIALSPAADFSNVVQLPSGTPGEPGATAILETYGVNQYVVGGGAVFTTNPFTGLPWARADLNSLFAGFWARWRNTNTSGDPVPAQRLSFDDFTVEVIYRTGPVPTLTVSSANVGRGSAATFTVTADPSAVISDWSFSGPDLVPITRTTGANSATWQGTIVAPGTAAVRVTQHGETFDLTRSISVTPRNWSWVAVAPTSVANGTFVTLPSPPVSGGRLGAAHLEVYYSFDAATVLDEGPNKGVRYTTAIRNTASAGSTRFRYQLSPDLMANNSAFYKAQCGNYNPQTQTGFIRGSTLRSNVQEHEYGTVRGHYQQYGAALLVPADNLGRVAELRARNSDATLQDFINSLQTDLNNAATRVNTAMSFEACNQFVEFDTTCTFRGFINFAPYASCR